MQLNVEIYMLSCELLYRSVSLILKGPKREVFNYYQLKYSNWRKSWSCKSKLTGLYIYPHTQTRSYA